MLLVDFVSVKLAKLERGQKWNGLGFDIAGFAIPERGQMKSNYLKTAAKSIKEVAAASIPETLPEDIEEQQPEVVTEET
jgi:hypothetical protein